MLGGKTIDIPATQQTASDENVSGSYPMRHGFAGNTKLNSSLNTESNSLGRKTLLDHNPSTSRNGIPRKQQYPEVEELVRAIRIQWRQAQKKVERYSKKLGTTFNTEHNQKVYQTIQTEYGNADGFGFQ